MRVHALDTAKGLGILLVVFGHAWRGGYAAGLDLSDATFAAVDRAIYAFHMPLFFFISGLLFWETLNKRPLAAFLPERVVRLLWPMALWTWIFFGVKLLAGSAANQPVALSDVQWFPLPPYEHMWFLWALFLIQLVVALAFGASAWTSRVFRVFAGVIGLGLLLALPFIDLQSDWFGAALQHTPYFLMAIAFGWAVGKRPSGLVALICLVVFAGLLGLAAMGQGSLVQSMVMVVCVSLMIAFWDSGDAAPGPLVRVLRWVGQGSMAIYLSHTIFSAGLREAMLSLGLNNAVLVLLATTLIGVLVPLALFAATRRNRMGRLLGF